MTFFKYTFALATLSALAACGGSGGGGSSAEAEIEALTYAQISERGEALFDEFDAIDATAKADVPTSGRATYDGFAGFEASAGGETAEINGIARVEVRFGENSVGGRVTNLVTADEEDIDGQLFMGGGVVDRSRSQVELAGDLRGDLIGPDGEDVRVDGEYLLGLGRDDASAMAGILGGDITIDGADGSFFGILAAEAD